MYDLMLDLNRTIDQRAKEVKLQVDRHGSDLNHEIQTKFSSYRVLDDLRTEFDSAIAALKAITMENEVDELKKHLQRMTDNVEQIDVDKPNVTFIFESDVTDLLNRPNSDKEWRSEFFFCRG